MRLRWCRQHCTRRLLKTTIHYVSSFFCFFHLEIPQGVISFGFIIWGFVCAQDAHSLSDGSDDTLVGSFGTLCVYRRSCHSLFCLLSLLWLRSETFLRYITITLHWHHYIMVVTCVIVPFHLLYVSYTFASMLWGAAPRIKEPKGDKLGNQREILRGTDAIYPYCIYIEDNWQDSDFTA